MNCCEKLMINGVLTHEIGCPEAWRDYEIECRWCGKKFKPKEKHQDCCSHNCAVAYLGLTCDCEECNPPEENDG